MPKFRCVVLSAGLFFAALTGHDWSAQAQIPKTEVPLAKPPISITLAKPATAPVPTAPAPPNSNQAHALDSADLEAFFDGILPLQLERSDIAGASVLVMQGDKVLLQKGYGYADIKSKRPVDPETTIFRLASISKLFTWVSVMQLVEQGKLNLDTDVNQYLDFQIRPKFDKPITLRNLMTHTGGFEESVTDIIVTDPKRAVTLRDYLIQNQPMRLFAPGEIPAYSNYGVGLASYIVQRTSGQPFERYVQDHIFGRLGMTHSTFFQPPQNTLAKLPSEGYRANTTKPTVGFEIFNPVGAGGISSSATDMGRFGQALLNGGELDGKRILKQETLTQMWTPQFRASEQMPPICMGFYQDWRNNLRWIGHEGDLIAFHSLFFVEPTQKVVLFVSYNSAGGAAESRPEIINFFSDRYFPGASKPEFLKTIPEEMKGIVGTYQSTRRADSTKLALGNLFEQRAVTIDKDGFLHLGKSKDLRGHPVKLKPVGKDLWQDVDGQNKIFAIRDSNGKVVRIAVSFPGVQEERVPWYENGNFVTAAAGASLVILAAVLLASLLRTGYRIFLRKRPKLAPQPGTMWLTFMPRMAAFFWVILLISVGAFMASQSDDLMPPTPDWYRWFDLMNIVFGVAVVLSLFAAISAIRIWKRPNLRWITRVKFSLVGISCVILSWVALYWHLIGPSHRI